MYLTLGTMFGNTEVFRTALAGLAGEDVEVVVTVGADNDPAALEPVPANARVERYIPQAELLPRCSAVVHHGGSGTMYGSLAHGVPQVVLPQGADNFVNGWLLARCGAGVTIGPEELSSDAVRDGVRLVLRAAVVWGHRAPPGQGARRATRAGRGGPDTARSHHGLPRRPELP